jgi:hypothetical protein
MSRQTDTVSCIVTQTHMYILLTQTKTVTCKTEPSSCKGGHPHDKQHCKCLKIWSWVQEGLNTTTYWLTVSCELTLTLDIFMAVEDSNRGGGSSMDLWNVGILPQHYTASQPKPLRWHFTNEKGTDLSCHF